MTQYADLALLRLHFMSWRFKMVFVKRSGNWITVWSLTPTFSRYNFHEWYKFWSNVFFMEIYDATSKTNTMTIYTFFGENLKRSIVASSPLSGTLFSTVFFRFFCWYSLGKKRESLPSPKLLNQQNYLTHSALTAFHISVAQFLSSAQSP